MREGETSRVGFPLRQRRGMESEMTGLPFDKRFWICHYCNTECVSYPVLKEHKAIRCKRRAMRTYARRERVLTRPQMEKALAEGQKVLEEWGL